MGASFLLPLNQTRGESINLVTSEVWSTLWYSRDKVDADLIVTAQKGIAQGSYSLYRNDSPTVYYFQVDANGIIVDADEVTETYSKKKFGVIQYLDARQNPAEPEAADVTDDIKYEIRDANGIEVFDSLSVTVNRQWVYDWQATWPLHLLVTNEYRIPNYTTTEHHFNLRAEPDCPPPCGDGGSCKGMTRYALERNTAALTLSDAPLGYSPPRGPGVDFTLSYNQDDARTPDSHPHSNIGPKWNFVGVSWITKGPPNTMMNAERFTSNGIPDRYTGYNPKNGKFDLQQKNRSQLEWKTSPNRYERTLPGGTVETYGFAVGAYPDTRYMLTEVEDAQGNAISYTYDSIGRLTTITDAIGQETTFDYELTSDPYKITKATDPFNRTATLEYDALGRLIGITDVIGLKSQFAYDGDGTFITTLTTPYGTTKFEKVVGSNYRRITVTDPLGKKECVEAWTEVSTSIIPATFGTVPSATGLSVTNEGMNRFNSFYWDKKAYKEAMRAGYQPGDANFYNYAYWQKTATGPVGFPLCTKSPLAGRTWYMYVEDQEHGYFDSTVQPRPLATARIVENGLGGTTTQVSWTEYNTQGNATQSIDPIGRITKYVYAANGVDLLEVRQVDPNTSTEYLLAKYGDYTNHLPGTITDAAGAVTTTTYNAAGQPLTVTRERTEQGANDEVTTMTYYGASDPNGPEGALNSVDGPLAGTGDSTTYTYDSKGRVSTVTDSEGYATTTEYDAFDRVTEVTFPDSTTQETTYDKLDIKTVKDRTGKVTTYWYNPLRQLIMTEDAEGRITQYDYCNCGEIKMLKDAEGRETWWRFDAQGRVTKKIYPGAGDPDNPSTPGIVYTYETESGRLSTVTDEADNVTTYKYTLDGKLWKTLYTEATGFETTPDVEFTYSSVYPRRESMIDGQGTTTFGYHAYQNAAGAITVTPGAGKLASIDGPISGTSDKCEHIYDELGRLKEKKINGNANVSTMEYDALGRMAEITNNLGTFTYSYVNATSRVDTVTLPNGSETQFDYWPNQAATAGNGDQRLKQIKHVTDAAGTPSTLSQHDYEYSPDGQITRWQQTPGSEAVRDFRFAYDKANQLITAHLQTAVSGLPQDWFYTYDKAGNRVGEQIDTTPSKATFNDLNQLTQLDPGVGKVRVSGSIDKDAKVEVNNQQVLVEAGNKFQTAIQATNGTTQFTIEAEDFYNPVNTTTKTYEVVNTAGTARTLFYDDNGNLIEEKVGTTTVREYKWDALNRLVVIEYYNPSGAAFLGSTEMSYDGMSRRYKIVEKDSSGATTSDKRLLWCGTEIVEERDSSNNVVKRFYSQGVHVPGASSPSDRLFYTRDHLGSIRELVDSDESVGYRYDYDPYGRQSEKVPTSGLQIWLRADSLGLSDGASISQWTDQSAAGNNATQATSANQPTFETNELNGKPVVRFDGTSDFMTYGSGFADFTSGITIFVVVKPTSSPYWGRFIELGNGSSGDNILFARSGTSSDLALHNYTGTSLTTNLTATSALENNKAQVVSYHQAGTTGTLSKNGKVYASGTAASISNVTRTINAIGKSNWAADQYFQGDIAEILVFNRALTPSEVTSVENYLGHKYAIDMAGADFRFTGHYYHQRSGLHLALYRAYDAGLGRWISRDPINEKGGSNLYAYCQGNPINRIDPKGLVCGTVVKRIDPNLSDPEVGLGHQWIEYPGGSKGFWPASDASLASPQCAGKLESPDPHGGDIATRTWDTEKTSGGSIQAGPASGKKCCYATCTDIVACLKAADVSDDYNLYTFNCRDASEHLLSMCCLRKTKVISFDLSGGGALPVHRKKLN